MEPCLVEPRWSRHEGVAVRGRAFATDSLLEGAALAARFREAIDAGGDSLEAATSVAATLEGFYAAVIDIDEETILVADGARSIPLYYASAGVVSDRGRIVRDAIDTDRDPVAESEFLLTRYVAGPETIWRGVLAIQPGEVVRLADGEIDRLTYRGYWPRGAAVDGEPPRRRLESALETALDRLERVAGGRPIVLPLSGGYDSRLLASALVARGRDVVAFTFGRSGHPDVEVSREVASRLGVRWEFLPYDESSWWEWYHGEVGRDYREQAFGGDALPFLAEVPALHRLLEAGRLPEDALYCPGHTVATPSERLPRFAAGAGEERLETGCGRFDTDSEVVDPSLEGLLGYVLDYHYTLWDADPALKRDAFASRISRILLGDRDITEIDGPASAAAAYERWEWRGRMATFTNGDLRAYDHAGLEWWLPLWDPAYVRAWERVPLEYRREKRLHAELAVERYRQVADVSSERAGLIDRTVSAADRHCALLRHTPVRQFTERDGQWDPPFLAPRNRWSKPGSHPLAWDGAVHPALRERLAEGRTFYALRVLSETGRLDLSDSHATLESPRFDRLLDVSADD
ncbi:asparagine synthase-related protein [Natrarchaeobaculum sulfurireducens]|nr:asparagine synthase-related protein [Natrarchaeobaculum sulfurireducens]